MADEDAESLAVTSSAAPWNAGALPSFVPVKMTATPEATVHSPNPTPQQEDNGQQQQQQQQYQLVDGQQPLLPKRKLQPDHCKEAVDIALNAHKQPLQQQHRLQLVDNTGTDFLHLSSHQRRKASEYAGLAPSSRSSKHVLAMADSQMYRKRVERKASEERSAAAERSSAAEADSFAEELSPDALGRHDRTPRKQKNKKSKKNKNKKKGKKSKRGSTLSTSPPRSPSVQHQQHQQRDQQTQPSSPSLPTPEISISREDSVTDHHNSTEPRISPDSNVSKTTAAPQTARRRDSSVVHLHTPEVLPPTTPQKSRRDGDEASDLQTPAHHEQHDDDERRQQQQQQQQQPDIFSDLLTPESAPQSSGSPADVAHLQLPPSAALIPLALRMSTKKKDNNKNNAYNTHATDRISDKGVLSPPGPHLAQFRRVNSRVSLTAPDDREQPSATSISRSQQRKNKAKQQQNNNKRRSGADVSQAARRGQDGNESDGSAGHSQSRPHQPVRRISSSKTLSIVWAKRPQQPTSASHRALLRQQKQRRTKGGGRGGGGVKQLIKRKSAPQVPKKVGQRKQRVSLQGEEEIASGNAEDYEDIDEESGEEEEYDEALPDMPREKLDFSKVKPLVAQRNSRAGQAAQRNSHNPQKPSSQRNSSSVNWRKRSSKTQQQQQHTVEHLPSLTGTHGAMGPTLPTGFRAEHRHSSVPPKSAHERFSSPEGESGSTQMASDGTHTFPDVLPQLVHGENNSDPSHQPHSQEEKLPQNTLEAVLARHRLTAEKAAHSPGKATPGTAGGASSTIPRPPQPQPPSQSSSSPLLHSSSQHASGSTNYYYDYPANNASHGPVSSFTLQGHRSLYPSPPVRQGTTRSGRRLGPAGTFTSATLSRSNTTTAIEKQKFAPLVAASSSVSNNASHHHSRSNVSSTPQQSFFQTHDNTTDLFGHSHAAVAAQQPPPSQRSSDAERPHATVVVAAVVGDDRRGGADDKRRSEDVRRSAVDTAARHEYPTVAPPPPLPRRRLPPVAREESDEGENSVHTPPSGSDGLTKSSAAPTPPSPPSHQKPQRHLRKPNTVAPPHSQLNSDQPPPHRQQRASTPPRKPRPPVPPPPRRNNKVSKQKAARDRQLIGYAFAPYMPGMPAVSGGRVRQTPAIEVYRNQNVHQKRRMQNMKDRKRNNNMKKKNHQQQHDAIAKPKPIDYTALATQSDPLDYLLGRHGFWGETTTR